MIWWLICVALRTFKLNKILYFQNTLIIIKKMFQSFCHIYFASSKYILQICFSLASFADWLNFRLEKPWLVLLQMDFDKSAVGEVLHYMCKRFWKKSCFSKKEKPLGKSHWSQQLQTIYCNEINLNRVSCICATFCFPSLVNIDRLL